MANELVVPDGWTSTTLGSLGRYLNGRAFKKSEWSKAGRPIIRIQDLTGTNDNPNYFRGQVEDRYVVRSGDFLISWAATLGAYIWHGPEAVLNQHIFKVESNIDRRFHYHLVRERIADLQRNAHGSGMVHVTKDIFESTPVVIPLQEASQAAVADFIEAAEEKLRSAGRHVSAARDAAERIRAAVLAAACSGRLTEDWRESNADTPSLAQVLLKRQSTKEVRSPSDGQAIALPLPEFPNSFVVSTIGAVSDLIEYGTSKKCDAPASVGIPVLRMGNIQRGELDLSDLKYCRSDNELRRLRLQDGDLLFNRTNSPELVGKSAVFHSKKFMSFASYLIRVRVVNELADPDYVNFWINSAWGREWAQLAKTDGVSQSNINGSKLALMPIPLPPIDEQHAIVERASRMLAKADAIENRVRSMVRLVEKSSYAVLAKAFRGELSLNGADVGTV